MAMENDTGKGSKQGRGSPPSGLAGTLWAGGWLFTIGFGKLVWWQILLGLVAWPYFLGLAVR
jgi:hypothetical protein